MDREINRHGYIGYPVSDRPISYHRIINPETWEEAVHWIMDPGNRQLIGELVSEYSSCWELVVMVLYTWRDLFVEDVRQMPQTRLIEHRIPTYPRVVPKAAKLPLYTLQEEEWIQENIPKIEAAGIIARYNSP